MIERSAFGGACLNVGCIPTKMLVRPADVVSAALDSQRLGVHAQPLRVDWPQMRERVFAHRIDPIAAAGRKYRQQTTTLYEATAHFVGPRTLALQAAGASPVPKQVTADRIVIATGSRHACWTYRAWTRWTPREESTPPTPSCG